jgi:hypothetical protein
MSRRGVQPETQFMYSSDYVVPGKLMTRRAYIARIVKGRQQGAAVSNRTENTWEAATSGPDAKVVTYRLIITGVRESKSYG